MTNDQLHEPGLGDRLAPYARLSLERAARFAARLHADELSSEHWLVSLLEDEDCAATRLVLHAFADPATIGQELLALCSGIMVVGSGHSLPFSVLGVAALRAARSGLAAEGGGQVEAGDLFRAACAELPPASRERLAAAGTIAETAGAPPEEGAPPADSAPFFGRFSPEALRALGAACRIAAGLGRSSIGPAHLLLGCLEVDGGLRATTGLSPARARLALAGQDEDETPLRARTLRADERLRELLTGLPAGADSLDVLGWMLFHGTQELRSLLRRQRITPALHERSRAAFRDPELERR